jgi:anti-sigma factor ChrR (cupin superfamily)
MKADAMEEFDNRDDFEVTFFSGMERGGIDNGIGLFDIVDFMRREGRVNNIVREIKECLIVVFLDGGIDMDRETAMSP